MTVRESNTRRTGPHLRPEPRTGAPRRAPALPPRSTSGRRTTPFAFSAGLCSSVGPASLPLPLRRLCPASRPPPRGPWSSSSPGGGAEERESEAGAWTRRDGLRERSSSSAREATAWRWRANTARFKRRHPVGDSKIKLCFGAKTHEERP